MTQLSTTVQLGIEVNATAGTEETLVAEDYSVHARDIQVTPEIAEDDADNQRATLTGEPPARGSVMASISATMRLTGGGHSTAAVWHDVLEGCGMLKESVQVVTVGSVSNADQLQPGQTIGDNASEGSATKTGVFIHYESGTGRLWYLPVTGSFTTAETIYNYTGTQFSGTISAGPANGGYQFTPLTPEGATVHKDVTAEEIKGGYAKRIVGRGNASFDFTMNRVPVVTTTLQGPLKRHTDEGPIAKSFVTDVPLPPTPNVFKGANLVLRESGGSDVVPILTQVEIELGNQLTDRVVPLASSIFSSGYGLPEIVDRQVAVTIDPQAAISDFNIVGAAVTTATAAGAFKLPLDAAALKLFRARVSAYTSGNVTVIARRAG